MAHLPNLKGWKQHLHANDKEQIDAVTGLQAHATFFVVINRKPYIFVSKPWGDSLFQAQILRILGFRQV